MYAAERQNKQCSAFCRQTIPPCASFTRPLVSIPPSISKTWLKCSLSEHLCWRLKKKKPDSETGGENEPEKVKRKFYSARVFFFFFPSFTDMWKTHRHSNCSLYLRYHCITPSPPQYPRTTPQQCRTQSPSLNNTSLTFLFQSFVKIPTAPFSPITFFVVHRGAAWGTQREGCGAR